MRDISVDFGDRYDSMQWQNASSAVLTEYSCPSEQVYFGSIKAYLKYECSLLKVFFLFDSSSVMTA